MKLFHDSEKISEIEGMLVKKFEERSEDRSKSIHLSDTGYCPYRVYCRLTGIKPLPFTKKSIGKMTIGSVGQTIIQQLYPEEFCEVEHPDMPSHVDVMEDGKTPIEVKFSAQRIFRASDVPEGWCVQLMGYMALHNSTVGWLLIMNIFSGQWTAFKLIMTQKELDQHREYLDTFVATCRKAADEEDTALLKALVDIRYKDDVERAKKCKYCDFRPGRNRTKMELGPGCPKYLTVRKASG